MKRSRFVEQRIIGILKVRETGVSVAELCRKHGMSAPLCTSGRPSTAASESKSVTSEGIKTNGFCSEGWRFPRPSDLKSLKGENSRLKRLLADAMLADAGLKDLLGKKW